VSRKIEIVFNGSIIEAMLNDLETSKKLIKILPIKSVVNLWGSEIYFEVPIEADLENGKELMEIGNIAFWPPGNSLCIFFGPTPVGDGTQPRAISPVTVIGKITSEDGIEKLKKVEAGDTVEVRLKK
jgi:hypothetical protein